MAFFKAGVFLAGCFLLRTYINGPLMCAFPSFLLCLSLFKVVLEKCLMVSYLILLLLTGEAI